MPVKKIMTKKPISIDKNELAAKALSLMNNKKITSLCVYEKKKNLLNYWCCSYSYNFTIKYFLNEKKKKIFFFFYFFFFIFFFYI